VKASFETDPGDAWGRLARIRRKSRMQEAAKGGHFYEPAPIGKFGVLSLREIRRSDRSGIQYCEGVARLRPRQPGRASHLKDNREFDGRSNVTVVGSALARRILAVPLLLGSMSVSYLAVVAWGAQNSRSEAKVFGGGVQADAPDNDAPVNPFASANGTHLIAFVLTASDCGWSRIPESMEAVGRIRDQIRSTHGDSYAQVTVVGVALDRDIEAGIGFLSEIGKGKPGRSFDQVMIGGGWLNEQVVRFAWRERIAEAVTPSVIVIERPVNTESYVSTSTIDAQADRLLVKLQGRLQIVAWMNAGMPLNNSDSVSEFPE
jgi:hypothetical protein